MARADEDALAPLRSSLWLHAQEGQAMIIMHFVLLIFNTLIIILTFTLVFSGHNVNVHAPKWWQHWQPCWGSK
jgi:hypothetical protein